MLILLTISLTAIFVCAVICMILFIYYTMWQLLPIIFIAALGGFLAKKFYDKFVKEEKK